MRIRIQSSKREAPGLLNFLFKELFELFPRPLIMHFEVERYNAFWRRIK